MSPTRIYQENPKHKPGCVGQGPPRWFPDYDTPCPDDIDVERAQMLLDEAIDGSDLTHPDKRALYALDDQGRFFKAYCHLTQSDDQEGELEYWHGYEVHQDRVPRQVPTRILRRFVELGLLSRSRYKKLLGSAQ